MARRFGHSSLQIQGGRLGGRKILGPLGRTTRPMTGLAKKSLFSTLRPWLDGAVVLDLYCGTGTLGIEAISEGAAHVCFCEMDASALSRLKKNLAACEIEKRAEIWAGAIEARLAQGLAGLDRPVDVAFLDPPFPAVRQWDFDRLERVVFAPLAESLEPQGLVVLRTPADIDPPATLGPLSRAREKSFGQMVVHFYAHPHAE
jgi:16S rRNA (guanine966-N2)-methyltransferase